jgi:hypothetical protein
MADYCYCYEPVTSIKEYNFLIVIFDKKDGLLLRNIGTHPPEYTMLLKPGSQYKYFPGHSSNYQHKDPVLKP